MLNTLKKMWHHSTATAAPQPEHDIALAITALMVQVMQQDDHLDDSEQQAITQALQERFGLSATEAKKHMQKASDANHKANDLHQFTAPLIKAYSIDERIEIIRDLWRIAMADKHIDAYEEALIRKVAELIGVHHHQFIDAKIQAKASL